MITLKKKEKLITKKDEEIFKLKEMNLDLATNGITNATEISDTLLKKRKRNKYVIKNFYPLILLETC